MINKTTHNGPILFSIDNSIYKSDLKFYNDACLLQNPFTFVPDAQRFGLLIYEAFCLDVAQGRMKGAPYEIPTREVMLFIK